MYVVQIHANQQDMLRIFVDEWTAKVTAELLKDLYPLSSITVTKVAITKSCEVVRQDDEITLKFKTVEDDKCRNL